MTKIHTKKRTDFIFLSLVIGLLFLRFPFAILLSYHKIPISGNVGSKILFDGTYLITAILIIIKSENLSNYNIDFLSLVLFVSAPVAGILAKYLSIKAAITGTVPVDKFKIAVSVLFLFSLIVLQPSLRKESNKKSLIWFLISVIVGVFVGIVMGVVSDFQDEFKNPNHPSILYFFSSIIIQLNNAAITTEPLFRGFLWGILKNRQWKDHWIWLFQAILFTFAHIYYLGKYNYSFFIIVPISSLILGLLVWRSRSIGVSMITHSLINSIGDTIAHFTW